MDYILYILKILTLPIYLIYYNVEVFIDYIKRKS